MSSLKFLIIGTILVASAHGASVAGKTGDGNCTLADHYLGLSCGYRMTEFAEKVKNLETENDEDLKEFKRSCVALEDCTKTIGHCEVFQEEDVKRGFAMLKTMCSIITFFSEQFDDCEDKLDNKNSTCYQDYSVFGAFLGLKDETKVQESCKTIFGKDNCMKKDIVELCGQKEWVLFRDTLIAVDDAGKKCNLKADL